MTTATTNEEDAHRVENARHALRERLFKLSPKLQTEAGERVVMRIVDELFQQSPVAVMTPVARLREMISEAEANDLKCQNDREKDSNA